MSNSNPKLTSYGWLVRLPNGKLQEFATDQQALEAARDEEEDEEA